MPLSFSNYLRELSLFLYKYQLVQWSLEIKSTYSMVIHENPHDPKCFLWPRLESRAWRLLAKGDRRESPIKKMRAMERAKSSQHDFRVTFWIVVPPKSPWGKEGRIHPSSLWSPTGPLPPQGITSFQVRAVPAWPLAQQSPASAARWKPCCV